MIRRFTRRGLLAAGICLAAVLPWHTAMGQSAATDPDKPLVLGVFAFRPKPIIEDRFAPLARYLTEHLDGRVVKVMPLSSDELADGIRRQTVDFVLTNPSHFVELRESQLLSGALATMVPRQNQQAIHGIGGVIIRRAERTDLRNLANLENTRIAIAGKNFLGTYMAPAAELLRAGIDLTSITWVETTQPVDQVITSVLDRKADAGFVRTGVLEDLISEGKLRAGELAIIHPQIHPGFGFLASTRLYPEWPFLAVRHVDDNISRVVSKALFALKPHDPAAQAASLYGFTIPADYAPVEKSMRDLRMPPYDQAPPFNWADVWAQYGEWVAALLALAGATTLLSGGLVWHRRRLLLTQRKLGEEHRQLVTQTERLNYLMDSSPVMFYTLRVSRHQTEPTWVGSNIERLLGYTPEQAMELDWWRSHLHPDDREQALADMRQLHLTGHVRQTYRFADTQGNYRWFDNEVRLLNTQSGQMEALGVWRDVTVEKESDDELKLAASVFGNSYDGIIITDAQHHIVDTNPAFTRITGLTEDDVRGRSLVSLARAEDTQQAELLADMPHWLAEHGHWQGELVLQSAHANPLVCALAVSAVRNSRGEVAHHVAVFSDISHIKAHQAELDRLAHYDPLTGIPNRRMLLDRLLQAIERARRGGHALAVCYLDLDDFKPVNDRLGHAVGDQLLITITRRLQQALRTHDTLARLGGDEFVLLLTDLAQPNEWQSVMDRVLAAVQQPVSLANTSATVSASIGVTVFPDDHSDADALLRHADQAMYQAKQAGRNRYHLFDMAQDKEVQVQRAQHARLEQALLAGELRLFYQPKVDLETGQVVGAEALVRWQHPEQGLLAPGAFLWQLTGTPLEISLGEWVVETALAQLMQWKATLPGFPPDFCISVNLSGHQLLKPGFQAWLQNVLQRFPSIGAGELELEILESAALADMDRAAEVMTECRAMGVRFALDDFGTGYSSLAYFRTLPVDVIKIDQSFVRDMLQDTDDMGIVQSVVYLAHAFHRPVIAEGVETLAHAAALLRLGCHLAQGYGIGRPMPAGNWTAWLHDWQMFKAWETLRQPA
ncbi:MAG TPA: EAL domain-containing protein [Burkholderiaceae bacterium]|nr:EAL domain-containing protein [Burkholderiaceae bacterium]